MRTRVETTYICEICGAEFDSESVCRHHEEDEKLLLECRFWDSSEEEVIVENSDYLSEEVWYMYIPTADHAAAVQRWFDSQGMQSFIYDGSTMYWYSDCGEWVSTKTLREFFEHMEQLAKKRRIISIQDLVAARTHVARRIYHYTMSQQFCQAIFVRQTAQLFS